LLADVDPALQGHDKSVASIANPLGEQIGARSVGERQPKNVVPDAHTHMKPV
jgi:hypothetical protein